MPTRHGGCFWKNDSTESELDWLSRNPTRLSASIVSQHLYNGLSHHPVHPQFLRS